LGVSDHLVEKLEDALARRVAQPVIGFGIGVGLALRRDACLLSRVEQQFAMVWLHLGFGAEAMHKACDWV
jgi:hypothetical protein